MDTLHQLTLGQVNEVIRKLGGARGALRFLRGKLVVSVADPPAISVWKTITLGNHTSERVLRSAFSAAHTLSHEANSELGRWIYPTALRTLEVDLVTRTVFDLGFVGDTPYAQICTRAIDMGLGLCPAEVGPVLRLAYTDQPRRAWLHIAMNPFTNKHGEQRIFSIGRTIDRLSVRCAQGGAGDLYPDHCSFVFVLPRD